MFLERHSGSAEVTVLLSSPSIPTSNPSIASLSSLPPSSTSSGPQDNSSVYSSASYGRGKPHDVREGTSMHLLSASGSVKGGAASVRSGRTNGTQATEDGGKSKRTAKSLAPSVPEHKIKFEEFHNQVRSAFVSATVRELNKVFRHLSSAFALSLDPLGPSRTFA